ncbi:lysine biosynthesis protein LysX [Candidatus Nitrosocosmicus arcticus]|uniref:Alpha-aminoadipate--lysW ligase lysX n=1 Tax=Candidatus Nitrosocosmicus arcticus TaxID=2035267 RepID=A0A557SVJ0_9ARCH|nr:lysine biosynthesis protein LysX [Candidatus Nitrosocosmicus arcticus]TVP40627.1 alpha-aminoadipate--lysW ligase lysX [Candidatus Nitrosocosmicus arcticus]
MGTINIEEDKSSLYILFDNIRWEEKSIIEKAKQNQIDLRLIDCRDLVLFLNEDSKRFKDRVILQRCISYFRSLHSTAGLEGLGARMINSLYTSFMCGNKLISHIELQKNGIQTPNAMCAFSTSSSIEAAKKFGYPIVIKPTVGSWGRLIGLLNDEEAVKAVLEDREHMFPIYHINYFEEFIKRPPRDIRAIVIGDEVVAAIYRYSGNNEWKTNMALGGHASPCPITTELEDICIKSSKIFKGDIVGVDLMESEKYGLVVHEVNNTTEFKNTVRVTGVDIPGLIVDYMVNILKK